MSVSREVVSQEEQQAETSGAEGVNEGEAKKEKELGAKKGLLNKMVEFLGSVFADDLSSYDADKEDNTTEEK